MTNRQKIIVYNRVLRMQQEKSQYRRVFRRLEEIERDLETPTVDDLNKLYKRLIWEQKNRKEKEK